MANVFYMNMPIGCTYRHFQLEFDIHSYAVLYKIAILAAVIQIVVAKYDDSPLLNVNNFGTSLMKYTQDKLTADKNLEFFVFIKNIEIFMVM